MQNTGGRFYCIFGNVADWFEDSNGQDLLVEYIAILENINTQEPSLCMQIHKNRPCVYVPLPCESDVGARIAHPLECNLWQQIIYDPVLPALGGRPMGVPIGAQAPCKDYCQSAHILFYIAQVKDRPRLALFLICSLKIPMDGIFL